MVHAWPIMSDEVDSPRCALCGRAERLTFHHLIPRTLHSNKWFKRNFTRERMNSGVELCRDCHSAVHRFASEKELGRHYNTLELLRSHPQIERFAAWVGSRQGRHRTRSPKS